MSQTQSQPTTGRTMRLGRKTLSRRQVSAWRENRSVQEETAATREAGLLLQSLSLKIDPAPVPATPLPETYKWVKIHIK
jgi:hypothetical protein